MAATSPYTQNDYQAVDNYRPYELPINDIFKAISAQNQFWDAGAARVKAVYDNALNLKLSLEPNKAIRKQYIEDSEKQLTKLSSMDLSDPSVQRQGFALFKPLFQDEGIIYDDLTTRHYEKVRNDALMYRSKDNGKEYSDINFQYAMDGYSDFVNSKDRMAGKGFYENRKEYTPYYDYTEDFQKALKDCHPSSVEATSPVYGDKNAITGYMKESYVKSLSAAQAKGCIESGLSGKAQRQLQIEGSVAYKGNIPTLASDTNTYLSGVSSNLSTQLQQLTAQKYKIDKGEGDFKSLSAEDKAKLSEAMDQQIKATRNELDATSNSMKKIGVGDFTDIQNNYENYASSVYSYKKLYKKALASAYEDRRENYKADPVQMQAIKFSQDKYLDSLDKLHDVDMETMRETHAKEMKLLDLMYGTGSGSGKGSGVDVYRNPLTGEVTINPNIGKKTYPDLRDQPQPDQEIWNKLTAQVSKLNEGDVSNNLELYNTLTARAESDCKRGDCSLRESMLTGFNYGTTEDEWARFKAEHSNNKFTNAGNPDGINNSEWFKGYTAKKITLPDGTVVATGDTDNDVNKWSSNHTAINLAMNTLDRKIKLGEKQVAAEIGPEFYTKNAKRIQDLKSVNVGGATITPQEVQAAMEGKKGGRLEAIQQNISTDITPDLGTGALDTKVYNFTLNGKPITDLDSPEFIDLANQINRYNKSSNDALNAKRVDVYNRLGFDKEPWFQAPNGGKGFIVDAIKSALPKDSKGKEADVRILYQDFAGGIQVTWPGMSKSDINTITSLGLGTDVEIKDGVATIHGTNYNVVPQAINNPILKDAAYQLMTMGETSTFQNTQPGAKVPNSDISVPVMVRGKQEMITIETYSVDSKPEYRAYLEGAGTTKPIVASNPYELFEKLGRAQMDFKRPVKSQ